MNRRAISAVTADLAAVTGDGKKILLRAADVKGFRAGLRGRLLLADADLKSAAFKKCYDDAGIRHLPHLELEKTEKLERMRACSTRAAQQVALPSS